MKITFDFNYCHCLFFVCFLSTEYGESRCVCFVYSSIDRPRPRPRHSPNDTQHFYWFHSVTRTVGLIWLCTCGSVDE